MIFKIKFAWPKIKIQITFSDLYTATKKTTKNQQLACPLRPHAHFAVHKMQGLSGRYHKKSIIVFT